MAQIAADIQGAAGGQRELTLRTVLTGITVGALLTPCNVYSGLKIGWSFNMSIAAGLLALVFWRVVSRFFAVPAYGMLENNINQTTASSAASIISGGLVAPIPALALLTDQVLPFGQLALWVTLVSLLGVAVAVTLRRSMIEREGLRFPAGVATAETLQRLYDHGREAALGVRLLAGGALVSGGLKLLLDLTPGAARVTFPLSLPPLIGAGRLAQAPSLHNLGLAFDPSLLMVGFGAIIGLRAGLSLLFGAFLAWGVLGPVLPALGWVEAGPADGAWYGTLIGWLVWPGATLVVVASLASFTLSLLDLRRYRSQGAPQRPSAHGPHVLGFAAPLLLLGGAIVIACQALFGIVYWAGALAVAVSFALAVVSARVTGETGITPVGALGKVTQLGYGIVTPGDVTANLMTANVTGGAAGQAADLMHDLKTGALLGATPARQFLAQIAGILTGGVVGSAVYLVLIPDPAAMLLTPKWPAPAVATWKAVAEVLAQGLSAIPTGAPAAMACAALVGLALAVGERLLPRYRPDLARWLPSGPALGLAFVVPAWNAVSLCLGAVLAASLSRAAPRLWTRQRITTVAAGLVAGESLAGVGLAIMRLLGV